MTYKAPDLYPGSSKTATQTEREQNIEGGVIEVRQNTSVSGSGGEETVSAHTGQSVYRDVVWRSGTMSEGLPSGSTEKEGHLGL